VDPKQMAQGMGVGRVALGAGFVLMPGLLGKLWVGDAAASPGAKLLIRAVGVRDLVLGVGILSALQGRNARTWVQAAAASDAVDVAAAALAGDSIPGYARWAVFLLGGGSAIQGAIAAPRLGD
jgi:hypothetical protein